MKNQTTAMPQETYNGWANYETWNVSLWMQNSKFLYSTAIACVEYHESVETPYDDFIRCMMNCDCNETADGVRWDDPKINHDEINEMMLDNYNEENV
jgi:hypothetical protein